MAVAPWTRMVGLLSRASLEPGEGMVFPRCRSIHTWGMRCAIDVVFLHNGCVLKVLSALGPWRVASVPQADTVVELPAGAAAAAAIEPGVRLKIT